MNMTDIAALREQAETAKACGGMFAISGEQALALLDQLEAERQRADEAELELIKPLPIGELIQRLEGQTYEKWFSQSDLKGDQVPVAIDSDIVRDANRYRFLRDEDAWGEDSDSWDVETKTGLISSENLMGGLGSDQFDAAVDARMAASDIPFFNPVTAPQKPVVVLTDCDIGAVSHMAHWYSEEQCEAWVAGVEHAKKQIVAAGCIVQTGDTDTGDDHQSSAPAVLRDVLTTLSIGGSRTELIAALTAIKPKFGAPGSRDVDVRAAHVAIDKAIEKLSNL